MPTITKRRLPKDNFSNHQDGFKTALKKKRKPKKIDLSMISTSSKMDLSQFATDLSLDGCKISMAKEMPIEVRRITLKFFNFFF